MKTKLKKYYLLLGLLILALIIYLAVSNYSGPMRDENASQKTTLRVVTTLFPLYDMAKTIGGSEATVSLLLPPGVEAHAFSPSPGDVMRIREADIFIYTGDFMEPWAKDIIKGSDNKNLLVVDASQGITLIPSVAHDADESVGAPDPHIWLDFDNAELMADNIAQAFKARDNAQALGYDQRLNLLKDKFRNLDALFRSGLADCRTRQIIYGGHYAFGYLAKRYNLVYAAAQGVAPDSEPTASDLASLVEQIKQYQIKTVFYEELSSPKIATTIAGETGASLLLLNAGHNISKGQLAAEISFNDILLSDLNNLRVGLDCR